MHNAAFSHLKIDAEYRLFEIQPELLTEFLQKLNAINIKGLNVTVPYKEKVLDFAHILPESNYLKKVGALNTLVNKDGRWLGFNTDISGFTFHLKENFDPSGRSAVVLGAGGAGRAVCYALANMGAAEIVIFDVDKRKSENVVSMIRGIFADFHISYAADITELALNKKDLLVNATPLGLKGSDPCPVNVADLHKGLFVYDLIYNPSETRLLGLAREAGLAYSNGLGMLLYQGAKSFEYFTGMKAPVEVMRKALVEALYE
jgi:shikimate dehydrogenase